MAGQRGSGDRLPPQLQSPPAALQTQSPHIYGQRAVSNQAAPPSNVPIDTLQHKAATFPLASHQNPHLPNMIPPSNSHPPSTYPSPPPAQVPVNQCNHNTSSMPHHKPPALTSYRPPAAYQAAYQPPPGYIPSKTPPPPEVVAPSLAEPVEKRDESPKKKRERKRDAKDGGREDAIELGLEILGGITRAL